MLIDEVLKTAIKNLQKKSQTAVIEGDIVDINTDTMMATVKPVIHNANIFKVRLKALRSESGGSELIPEVGSRVFVDFTNGNDSEPFITKSSKLVKARFNVGSYELSLEKNETTAKESVTINNLKSGDEVPKNEVLIDETGISIKNVDRTVKLDNTTDKIEITDGTHSVTIDSTGIHIDGGGNTINIDNATVNLNGDNNGGLVKIETLIEKINQLEDKLKTHEHVYLAATGVPAVPTKTTPTSVIPPAGFTDPTLVFPNTQRTELENTNVNHGN